MKFRFTSTILLLLLFSANSFATVITRTDSTKNAYYAAKQEIEDMLNGKSEPSYEKAIYLIENAWYANHLNKDSFTISINGQAKLALRLMRANWRPPAIDTTDIYTPAGQRQRQYTTALANWAIYKMLVDTVRFANGDFHAPYQYSTNDPMGSIDWRNTQVSNLDTTRQGNCFALSSLFKILSDRLGSEASLSTAPGHIYIRHADDKGILYNIEVGSRDFPGTGTISTLTYSTTEAIRNNIALRKLSDKQAIALCLVYLAKGYEHKFNTKTDSFLMDCAETTLKYDATSLNAMLLKAEVLEARLIAQGKSIAQLQANKELIAYEKLLTQLYSFGYREIPADMKSLLVKTFTIDSVQTLQAVAYTREDKTRYASLSWGMFDEAHEAVPTERYSNTFFDTQKKKLVGFEKEQNIYNDYNFDPVVFALSIDPLTKKYPNVSPYASFNNNPIFYIDKDGQEPDAFILNIKYDYKNRIITADVIMYVYSKVIMDPRSKYDLSIYANMLANHRYEKNLTANGSNLYPLLGDDGRSMPKNKDGSYQPWSIKGTISYNVSFSKASSIDDLKPGDNALYLTDHVYATTTGKKVEVGGLRDGNVAFVNMSMIGAFNSLAESHTAFHEATHIAGLRDEYLKLEKTFISRDPSNLMDMKKGWELNQEQAASLILNAIELEGSRANKIKPSDTKEEAKKIIPEKTSSN